ncbi:MAG: hypothetical protein AAB401_17260, partial [Acidobacteriota bacterium]
MTNNKGFFQPVLSGTFARKLMLPVAGVLLLLAAIAFPQAWQFGGQRAAAAAATTKTDAFPTLKGASAMSQLKQ